MWIQFFRYVTFAAISAAAGLVGVLDGDVPRVVAPFLVALGTVFVNSAVLALATAVALRGRRPTVAWRAAFVVALLAVPFLFVVKPPRRLLLDPAPCVGASASNR